MVEICGTEASSVALQWAVQEAQQRHAGLLVCYVWQVQPSSAHDVLHPARAVPAQQGAAPGRVHRWVRQVLGPDQIELQVTHGGPPLPQRWSDGG